MINNILYPFYNYNSYVTQLVISCLIVPIKSQKRGKGITLGLVDTAKPTKFGPGIFVVVILILMFCAVSKLGR